MCLAAAQHVIDERRYAELGIPEAAIPAIEWAWNNEPPALYGRFDVAWNGKRAAQAARIHADTPTSLLEAAVVQWDWLEELLPSLATASHGGKPDQFNSLHDKLIAKWKDIAPSLQQPVYFAGVDSPEDQLTLAYLRDTAQQAGLSTLQMFHGGDLAGTTSNRPSSTLTKTPCTPSSNFTPGRSCSPRSSANTPSRPIKTCAGSSRSGKLLLSNKGILPVLWQLYPNHELLLPAYFDDAAVATGDWQPVVLPGSLSPTISAPHGLRDYVRKPLFSREGANITLVHNGVPVASTEGPYTGQQIVQALAPESTFAGRHPVLGLWMVDQECCGLGVRESAGPITDKPQLLRAPLLPPRLKLYSLSPGSAAVAWVPHPLRSLQRQGFQGTPLRADWDEGHPGSTSNLKIRIWFFQSTLLSTTYAESTLHNLDSKDVTGKILI